MRERFLKKALSFVMGATLAITGTVFTSKVADNPFIFDTAAATQRIRIHYCQQIAQQGFYSWFEIQCVESNFGHTGTNYTWMTHTWGIPQYKVSPYFNPFNVSPSATYAVPKSLLDDNTYWIKGSITIQ